MRWSLREWRYGVIKGNAGETSWSQFILLAGCGGDEAMKRTVAKGGKPT